MCGYVGLYNILISLKLYLSIIYNIDDACPFFFFKFFSSDT